TAPQAPPAPSPSHHLKGGAAPGSAPMFRRLAVWALAMLLAAPGTAVVAQSLEDKIAQCTACHGDDGRSSDPRIPHIGGQPKLAVMYQLFFYREGQRK